MHTSDSEVSFAVVKAQIASQIPTELWLDIAENLSSPASRPDILRFGRVSKTFNEISNRVLYRELVWSAWPVPNTSTLRTQQLNTTLMNNQHLFTLVRSIHVNGTLQGEPWYPGLLPLAKFVNLQRLEFTGIRFSYAIYRTIAGLPALNTLILRICHPGSGESLSGRWISPGSTSLERLELIHPNGNPRAYFPLFTRLGSFTLTASRNDSLDNIQAIIDFNLFSTLTFIKVQISTEETSIIFQEFLSMATELRELDIRKSQIKTFSILQGTLPNLHTYRGPPQIAGTFLYGRAIHTVSYTATSSTSCIQHFQMLTWPSIQIRTLVIDIHMAWTTEYTKLVTAFTPHLTRLVIECRYIEDLDAWPTTLLSKLPALVKFRTQTPPNGQIVHEPPHAEEARIESWGTACPTLQEIDISGSEHEPKAPPFIRWLREADNEWTLYRYT